MQLLILITLALCLTAGLIIFFYQIFKQKKLMKKKDPEEDIRQRNSWAKDYKDSYFNNTK